MTPSAVTRRASSPTAVDPDGAAAEETGRPAPAEEAQEAPDKGAFLRLFSGLRE